MPSHKPSLLQFDRYFRKDDTIIPHAGSNTFFDVGGGRINVFTVKNDSEGRLFNLYTDRGDIYLIGSEENMNDFPGGFVITPNGTNFNSPYQYLTIINGTKLIVNHNLTIRGANLDVYGTLELDNSALSTIVNGTTVFHPGSVLVIDDHSNIHIDNQSSLIIYGRIDIHVTRVQSLLNSRNIFIDSAAVFNVEGINEPNRTFSFTNYEREMRERGFVNVNVQGERIIGDNRIGHIWRQGNPSEPSHVIGINLQLGQIPLGDFRFPVLGRPKKTYPGMQTISDLVIRRKTTLHITEEYNGHKYFRPELYLGGIIDNTQKPAECIVQGTIIVDGPRSMITVDRKAILRIEERGIVYVRNGAIIKCTHNQEYIEDENGNVTHTDVPVLHIFGTLVIDDISQIVTFNTDNIVFGPEGKVVILNPSGVEPRILFSIPNGIFDTHLYRLFEHRVQHVEYHISKNTGVAIDQDFPNITPTMGIRVDRLLPRSSKEFSWMFGDRRIEQAVHEGIVVWHDDAFIELYHNISPWMNETINLLSVSWLFKAYGSYAKDRLQDVVDRLTYAGFGNILFRFVLKNAVKEIKMSLESINMENVMNNPLNQRYVLNTDNSGTLFIRSRISDSSVNNIIHPRSRTFNVPDEHVVEFILP